MQSDDGPPGADDQLPYGEPQPVPPQRPSWLIWTIVGGTAALVAAIGVIVIVAVAKRGPRDGGSEDSPTRPMAAVEQLRSRLPAELKSADTCAETSPQSYATSTIACTWPKSHVPHTAIYSLFEDSTSMLRSAMTLVRGSGGYGDSCRSADDFNDNGGQMLWEHDGRERGTVWCYLNENEEPVILWTDTAPKILASAVAREQQDAKQLLDWFLTSGRASIEATPSPQPPPPSVPKSKSSETPSPDTSTSDPSESTDPPTSDPPVDPTSPAPRPSQSNSPRSRSPETSTPPTTDPPIGPPVDPGNPPSPNDQPS